MASRILVTGAAGFVGRHVVAALQRLGFQIRGQYNRTPGEVEGVEWRQMNFMGTLEFGSLVAGCDAVVHLAAEIRDPSRMRRVNVEATEALLAAAHSESVRYFGHASSMVVYGSPRQRVIDETTPLLDPDAPMLHQYHAEPFMLEYARTKILAERAIRAFMPEIDADIYRLGVVADFDRLLEACHWSGLRRFGTAYRRTQYIFAPDAAAAVAHLVMRGLAPNHHRPRLEAFNICDEDCGTFRDVLSIAYGETGDRRFRLLADFPVVLDLAQNLAKYRHAMLRYPLGMLTFRNAKLLATGFDLPTGIRSALKQALTQHALQHLRS